MRHRSSLAQRVVPFRIRAPVVVALVAWIVLAPGVAVLAGQSVAAPVVRPQTTTSGDGYTIVEGTKAGALYAVLRPDDWNGDLALLLHGQVAVNEPVTLPPPGHEPLWSALVDQLIADGYGVAYSSYRTNGFAVREGTNDSRIAAAMFTAAFGKPDATYLVGISMGTHIGQRLVEATPKRYSGLLTVCGGFGGASVQWEYMVNARILFDAYFPGVLPGNVWSQTDQDFAGVVVPAVVAAITESPESFARAVELAGIDQLNILWTTPDELVGGIVTSLLSTGGGAGDFQSKAGGIAVDNTQTYYTGSADDAALNATVQRFAADPKAERFLQRFDPNGKLRGTPVLALHTTRDPLVQYQLNAPVYQALLADSGNAHLLASQLVDRFGHCAFTLGEIVGAFHDLVAWSETGVVPGS